MSESETTRTPYLATRWWRVIDEHGGVWAETTDEADARSALRPGYRLQRLYERQEFEWRNEPIEAI